MTSLGNQGPYWLDPHDSTYFPDVELAMSDPNGLLAIGGDLSTERLLAAYRHGVFPWYNANQPVLWWSPDPRAVLYLDQLYTARSLKKTIRKFDYEFRLDSDFSQVMTACASARGPKIGTWITRDMTDAYQRLHVAGYAHSTEVWRDERLVGGLYGIGMGNMFFGESMFSYERDTSKVALTALVHHLRRFDFRFIDCQVASPHLTSLGSVTIPRSRFVRDIALLCEQQSDKTVWEDFITRQELLALL